MLPKSGTTKKILKVIFDSNALFVPFQFKIDVFEELKTLLNRNFEPILLSPIRRELERLAEKGTSKIRKNAAYALTIAQKCTLVDVNDYSAASSDDAIVEIAKKWNSPVFTNDKQLRKRLRNINIPVIYVRQKSRLEIEGRL